MFNYWPPFTFVHEWSCDLGSNLCGGCGIPSVFLCTFLNNTGQQPLRSAEDDLISHSSELQGPPCPAPGRMAFLVSYQYVLKCQSNATTLRSIGREFRWRAIVCLVPGLCWVHYCASMHQVTTGDKWKGYAYVPFSVSGHPICLVRSFVKSTRFGSALLDAFPG